MGLDPISNIASAVKGIIDKFVPDANEKMKMQLELATKEIVQEHERLLAQANINLEEAKNPSLFVSGWRAAAGWVCVLGLAYTFLFHPYMVWIATLASFAPPPPIESGLLQYLLGAMLGIGGLRSFDKMKGVETRRVELK